MNSLSDQDKMLGCLYGQAIGDALGLGSEFLDKTEVLKYYPNGLCEYSQIIQDDHRKRWPKGAWTDDTEMMICIMKAYNAGLFNVRLIANNFKLWFEEDPPGIGGHTFKVLCMKEYVDQPELSSKLWWDLSGQNSAANGALMRTSVVGLLRDNVEKQTEDICKLTHFDQRCVGSCVIATLIIHNLIWNDKELSYEEISLIAQKYHSEIIDWIKVAYYSEELSQLNLDDNFSIGYTLRTLSAALWCYWHSSSFLEGLLSIVNEGGDADSNAAISCAILGAKFGYSSIPNYYIDNLHGREYYQHLISDFLKKLKK